MLHPVCLLVVLYSETCASHLWLTALWSPPQIVHYLIDLITEKKRNQRQSHPSSEALFIASALFLTPVGVSYMQLYGGHQ